MNTIIPELRAQLEKIAWKHYDPEASINVEEMLDEMAPILAEREALAEKRGEAKGHLAAVEVLHKYFMGTWDKKVMDTIEAAQKEILALLTQTSNTDL